jgi:diguanylate cyclase (GGDEF)-like protein
MPDLSFILQYLTPVAEHPLLFSLLMLLSFLAGAGGCAFWLYRRQRRWQRDTEETLEQNIQSRTLELQVALTELAEKNRELEEQNTRDALSGVRNRAYFDKKIQAEIKRSRREQRPLSLVMLDIDHFKAINDTHGHLAGDAVIRGVAQRIQAQLKRSSDHICRYGGEEFALILPNTNAAGVLSFAEQIRASIASTPFETEIGPLQVQISAGCFTNIAEAGSLGADYVQAADQALYSAKQAGRNQVKVYQNPDQPAGAAATITAQTAAALAADASTLSLSERDELAALLAESVEPAGDDAAAVDPEIQSTTTANHTVAAKDVKDESIQ